MNVCAEQGDEVQSNRRKKWAVGAVHGVAPAQQRKEKNEICIVCVKGGKLGGEGEKLLSLMRLHPFGKSRTTKKGCQRYKKTKNC